MDNHFAFAFLSFSSLLASMSPLSTGPIDLAMTSAYEPN